MLYQIHKIHFVNYCSLTYTKFMTSDQHYISSEYELLCAKHILLKLQRVFYMVTFLWVCPLLYIVFDKPTLSFFDATILGWIKKILVTIFVLCYIAFVYIYYQIEKQQRHIKTLQKQTQ